MLKKSADAPRVKFSMNNLFWIVIGYKDKSQSMRDIFVRMQAPILRPCRNFEFENSNKN